MSSNRFKTTAKVAFVGNFQYNCGSSNTLLGYVRAGANLGYDVRVSEIGYIDNIIRNSVPIAPKNWRPDLLVIKFDSYPFLSQRDIDYICKFIPRSKRVVVDSDGKYLPSCVSAGDTNHSTPGSYKYWSSIFDTLSDKILQPYVGNKINKKIIPFLYYAMNNNVSDLNRQSKKFELIYIGNNWYRWSDIVWLAKIINPIRSRLKKVALIGQYWSGKAMPGFEEATYSNPDYLLKNKIEVYESAPFGQVEVSMSQGLLNPILVRPILNYLEFITPRMFETLSADTVPLIPKYFAHALNLYGSDARKLILSDDPAKDILRILDDYETYVKLSRRIRQMLNTHHTYESRLSYLLQLA